MSKYTPIDLSKLPAPELIEELSYETIFNEMLAKLVELDPEFDALVESDPATKVLQVAAYREMGIRQRINDVARSRMLAYATGADLDHIGADREPPVVRFDGESDERFRARIALAPEGWSVAGPRGAYEFHALSAHADVKNVGVLPHTPVPGTVTVAVLSNEGDGAAPEALLEVVDAALNDEDIRPLNDKVNVVAAEIVDYVVEAELILYSGPDAGVVQEVAEQAVQDYVARQHMCGADVTISGLMAALHQEGVQEVLLSAPAQTLGIAPNQAAWCSGITVTTGGQA